MINALSVDVEDYFQVSAFEGIVRRSDWDKMESRVEANTERLLTLFDRYQVKATFFFLGWIAERYPALVETIHALGHEIASHGYNHRRITSMSKDEFRVDLLRAKDTIEGITGYPILGYRAPSFSITRDSLWALEILTEEGFAYDSSIFPILHDRYGIPDSPRFAWHLAGRNGSVLREFPISTIRILGWNLPFIGGGYLRHFPLRYVEWGINRVNGREQQPVVLYIHPWEVDPSQPRLDGSRLTRIRHYRNLDKIENRLDRLLCTYRFAPLRVVLGV